VIWWYISGLWAFPFVICGYLLSMVGWSVDVARAIAKNVRARARTTITARRIPILNPTTSSDLRHEAKSLSDAAAMP
jgi:hypothetical protein